MSTKVNGDDWDSVKKSIFKSLNTGNWSDSPINETSSPDDDYRLLMSMVSSIPNTTQKPTGIWLPEEVFEIVSSKEYTEENQQSVLSYFVENENRMKNEASKIQAEIQNFMNQCFPDNKANLKFKTPALVDGPKYNIGQILESNCWLGKNDPNKQVIVTSIDINIYDLDNSSYYFAPSGKKLSDQEIYYTYGTIDLKLFEIEWAHTNPNLKLCGDGDVYESQLFLPHLLSMAEWACYHNSQNEKLYFCPDFIQSSPMFSIGDVVTIPSQSEDEYDIPCFICGIYYLPNKIGETLKAFNGWINPNELKLGWHYLLDYLDLEEDEIVDVCGLHPEDKLKKLDLSSEM